MCARGKRVLCIVLYIQTVSHGINLWQHVSEVQISQVLIIFSHISHHEGVFIQPEGLVYILGFVCFGVFFFDNGSEELNAVTS